MSITRRDRFRGCLLGLAAGDAVGTALEFSTRGTFEHITDMVGGGPFQLQPGQWTDDTSMALCLASSLVETGTFDPADQMARYCFWVDSGYLSSTGTCFDIGRTVSDALSKFRRTGNPFAGSSDQRTAGNGSIMRLAPVPMFFFPDLDACLEYAAESSRTTHAAAGCIDACRLLAGILFRALAGHGKDEVLLADGETFSGAPGVVSIARGDYRGRSRDQIRASGYVVQCLEAALWCFATTDDFETAILEAANLGDDADTTAAVCGQVAGAHYGASGIPAHWLDRLTMRQEITTLADRLDEAAAE